MRPTNAACANTKAKTKEMPIIHFGPATYNFATPPASI